MGAQRVSVSRVEPPSCSVARCPIEMDRDKLLLRISPIDVSVLLPLAMTIGRLVDANVSVEPAADPSAFPELLESLVVAGEENICYPFEAARSNSPKHLSQTSDHFASLV